ncbi:mannonate dehydratase [Micromonospora sp. CPCC 205371]|nr:mannonate dehydratase [Micromonospora sp. CPCC 205371]
MLQALDQPANGLTVCVGLHGARPDDDLIAMIDEFGPRVHFTHLRSTHREADPPPFYEASQFDGDLDRVAIVWELPKVELRGERDHGGRAAHAPRPWPLDALRPDQRPPHRPGVLAHRPDKRSGRAATR